MAILKRSKSVVATIHPSIRSNLKIYLHTDQSSLEFFRNISKCPHTFIILLNILSSDYNFFFSSYKFWAHPFTFYLSSLKHKHWEQKKVETHEAGIRILGFSLEI